ncbi:MAG TPA: response regulator [Gemmatimonadales bacterium]|nr:response regulator [Gemmatimonadales bacterium]
MTDSSTPEQASGGRHPATVLIANDQEWSARSLESIFGAEGYRVLRAFTGVQAIKQAEAALPDVIILDRQMPDLDGAEVCRRLRADPRIGVTTPIIITTAGQAGRAQKAEAFEAGAWDFFGQPIEGEILLYKVRTFLQAKQAADLLRSDRLLDPATGLYTRTGLDRRAREIVAEARRNGQPVACVVFVSSDPDLDPVLERIEEVAQRVAGFFRESGRAADAVGRLGPLEFAVIAPGTTPEGAATLVDRLKGAMSDGDGRVTLRAGCSSLDGGHGSPSEAEELLARAGSTLRVAT